MQCYCSNNGIFSVFLALLCANTPANERALIRECVKESSVSDMYVTNFQGRRLFYSVLFPADIFKKNDVLKH